MKLWLEIATLAEPVILLGGLVFFVLQLRRMHKDRDSENVVAIAQRTVEHNWKLIADEKRRAVVLECEDIVIPEGMNEKEYWAARAVHLSHLNLLSQVWALGGRPGPKKHLKGSLDSWEQFARQGMPIFLGTKGEGISRPNRVAAQDIWKGMKGTEAYEVFPSRFVNWLEALAHPS